MNQKKPGPRIYIDKTDEYVGLSQKKSLLDVLLDAKIPIAHSCGGNGTCGTCLCRIEAKAGLPKRNEIEAEMAEERLFANEERLACQIKLFQESTLKEYKT